MSGEEPAADDAGGRMDGAGGEAGGADGGADGAAGRMDGAAGEADGADGGADGAARETNADGGRAAEFLRSDSPPESPRARFVAALAVRRNAAAGLVAGVAVSAAVYWVFVVAPPTTQFSPVLYLLLSFTVALAAAAVVALALTVVRAVRLWYALDEAEG